MSYREKYVKENGCFPIMEMTKSVNGDEVIITGDGNGYYIRYCFKGGRVHVVLLQK